MQGKLNHKERSHALLSCSGSERWLNCTPSARLEEEYGEFTTSPYAEEGTLAHELGTIFLLHDVLGEMSDGEYELQLSKIVDNDLFSDEMFEVVPVYVDYCESRFEAAKAHTPDAKILVEQSIDISRFVPEGFGSLDCSIIANKTLEIIDYKHGRGVAVNAESNRQLMLYGIGALEIFDMAYDIDEVTLTVVQPRRNNIASWTISKQELLDWANTELKEKARMAYEGRGNLAVGEWCKFCKVRSRCRAFNAKNVELAKFEFREPLLLSDDEISDILMQVNMLIEWGNSVKEYALSKALNDGKKWPGFKLVEGISRRKFSNEDEVADVLLAQKDISPDDIMVTKLQGITAIQKLLGKKRFDTLLSDLVIKPAGKPTLVDALDKRPEYGINKAIEDFKN